MTRILKLRGGKDDQSMWKCGKSRSLGDMSMKFGTNISNGHSFWKKVLAHLASTIYSDMASF